MQNKKDQQRVEILENKITSCYEVLKMSLDDNKTIVCLDIIAKCEAQISAIKSKCVETIKGPEANYPTYEKTIEKWKAEREAEKIDTIK